MSHQPETTISATQVIEVAYGTPDGGGRDTQKAITGIKAHRSIAHEVAWRVSGAFPGFESNFPLGNPGIVQVEHKVDTRITDALILSAQIDVWVEKQWVIEIKPSPRQTHFVQLALNALATYLETTQEEIGMSALYCYEQDKSVFVLEDNGISYWSQLKDLCEMAATLLSNEKRLDELKRMKKQRKQSVDRQYTLPGVFFGREEPDMIPAIANDSMRIRREFDPLFNAIAQALSRSATRFVC